ncbi:MAG: YceH family protein [Candidatus Anammoxibacter sp.]
MNINLTLNETRVIGSLIEKEITTPEQYPLSLNSLTIACNQKSNRDPVPDLDEDTIQQTVDDLVGKHMVGVLKGVGSRVVKIRHRFCNDEFGSLHFSLQQLGIICFLLLRGPQTPGELRSRTNRLCTFNDMNEIEQILEELAEREGGPFVVRLQREAGKREYRYAHLFSGDAIVLNQAESRGADNAHIEQDDERIASLELRVESMQSEINEIKRKLDEVL